MLKKIIKFACIAALVGLVLVAGGIFTLYKMYPPAKLKQMAQEFVAKNYQREITFDKISLTWIGFTLTNVALSENTTFADGTFVKADKITARVAVKPLLQKRIEIDTIEADGLALQIIQNKDGSFNFHTLTAAEDATVHPSAQTDDPSAIPLMVSAEKFALKNCDIVYLNNQTGMRLALNDLNINIYHFDLANPFETAISFVTDISGTGQPELSLPVTMRVQTHLADLDLPNASATLIELAAKYKSIVFNMQGDIRNFKAPQVNLSGSLTGINNQVLAELAPGLPNFTLPTIHMALQATADLDKSTALIQLAKLSVKNSSLNAEGNVGWAGPTPTYQLAGSLTANVNELVQMTDTVQGFEPGGLIKGNFKATEKKDFTDVSGKLTLQNLSALYPPFTLTQTSGNIVISSLDKISSPSITGKLNNENFTTTFSYQNIKDVMNIVFNLNLDKLVLEAFPSSSQGTQDSPQNQSTQATTSQTATRMNVQANVQVGGVKIPYVESQGFNINANLTDLTDTMAYTNGTVQFTLKPGEITNLDDFIKDSKIAKIILLPVAIVKKVAAFLKVDLFPTHKTGKGATIAFTKAEGAYTFTNGVMNINSTTFSSQVTDISATGSANFKTDALDMKATATLLTQAAPLSFKITGTMNDPKGKLDVLNTVSSVVGNLLNGKTVKSVANGGAQVTKTTAKTAEKVATGTANKAEDAAASTVRAAADIAKGIGSLFKKKKPNE